MTKLWTKIKNWFRLKSAQKKRILRAKSTLSKRETKPTQAVKPFNAKHYRQLIGKIAKQAIAVQRARQRRNC